MRAAVEASLRRLQTDRIDLYQLHRVDPEVPVEETWGAMADLVREGKVRALGLSEVDVATADRAMRVWPVLSVQSELSLWTRDALADVLPWCHSHGVAFLPFAPLGRGFLTGAVAPQQFGENDFRARNPRFTAEAMAANTALVDAVRTVAEQAGATPAQVAIAWTLAQSPAVVPIPGTKKSHYLRENAAAADLTLTRDALAALDALPAPVGARY